MIFRPNPRAKAELAAEVKRSGALHHIADAAANQARAVAPVRTGAYRDSIQVVEGENGPALIAGDWKALLIEFGTVKRAPVAPLRRAIAGVGLHLKRVKK